MHWNKLGFGIAGLFSRPFRRVRHFFRSAARTLAVAGALMSSGDAWGNVAPPAIISISQSPGQVTLTWFGSSHLETAYQANGPWYAVASGQSPYTVSAQLQQQYFRLNSSSVNSNSFPVAVNDEFTMQHDQTLSVNPPGVLENDSSPLSQPLSAQLVAGPASGAALTLNPDGSFFYTPPQGYLGVDSFTYVALAQSGQSLPATVSIDVTAAPPVAMNDGYGVHMNTPLTILAPGVMANDYDPDGYALQVVLSQTSGPANGALLLNWDGSFVYSPNTGFTGSDSFTYQITDLFAQSVAATVTLNVHSANAAPVANAGSYATAHDQRLSVTPPGVLSLASDADGDALTSILVSGTSNGVIALSGDGSFTYSPTPGFVGTDRYVYMVSDGLADSSPATITIQVTNSAPVANPDYYSTHPGETLTVSDPGVLLNDTDAEQDPLTAQLISQPISGGTVSLDTNGGFVYTPPAGFSGADTFTYSAFDGITSSAPAVVTINVTNTAPVAENDSYGVQMNMELSVPAPGVLFNDYDPAGENLIARTVISPPSHGSVVLQTNGSFTYQPVSGYVGSDSFTYVANNGYADSSPATVSLMVHSANTPPTTGYIGYYITPNSTLLPPDPYVTEPYLSVLTQDSDAENDELSAVLVRGPKYAQSFTLNSDGTFSYLPKTNFVGQDHFIYQAFDGLAYSTNTRVDLFVSYNPPNVPGSAYTMHFNTALSDPAPGVLADVGINDNTSLLVTAVATAGTVAQHGTVTLQTTGAFTYQPAANFIGNDSFEYQVYDGIAYSPAVVNITVTDTPPLAVAQSYFDAPATSLVIGAPGVLTNAYDADYDPLTAVLVSPPANASQFTLNPDGSFFYMPHPGFTGSDTFTYAASDGAMLSPAATVTIDVSGAPVAVPDVYAYIPGVSLNVTATNGVLQNDFDPNTSGPGLTAQLVAGSLTGGTLTSFNSDGSFTFVPPAGSSGSTFTFQYRAFDATLGLSPPVIVPLVPIAVPAVPPRVKLLSVTFSGGADVLPDNSGKYEAPFSKPHWKAGTANPYSYVQGAPITIDAEVETTGGLTGGTLTGTLYLLGAVDPTDKIGTVSKTFGKKDTPQFLGPTVVKVAPGVVAELLLDSVYKYNPLLIDWTYTTATGQAFDCGQSKNVIYLTAAAPVQANKTMFQTVLEIADKASSAKRQADVISASGAVWKYFVTRKVQLLSTTPPKNLTYYSDWATGNCSLYQLLKLTDAQCMTFAQLLTAVYRTQGIPIAGAAIVKADPIAGKPKGFLVKNWTPAPKATTPYYNTTTHTVSVGGADYYQPRAGTPGAGMYDWAAPVAPAINPEFIYNGGTGQNNATPAANFNCHFIVKVINGATTTYFDPSYGNTYTGADSMEATAVAGYYQASVIGSGATEQYRWTINPVDATHKKWLEIIDLPFAPDF